MELELSLGDSPAPVKASAVPAPAPTCTGEGEGHELVLELGVRTAKRFKQDNQKTGTQPEDQDVEVEYDEAEGDDEADPCGKPPGELSFGSPLLASSGQTGSVSSEVCRRDFDVNTLPVDGGAEIARSLSPSSMQMEVPARQAADPEAAEDEENGGGRVRKKLRLSKEQSAFLEDSFKEHSTLTPKQKSDLANRLNLRPRQVEVWFQNRRARTKLKKTEVDCEYLKRCCERLAQENRRLQREVVELTAFRSPYQLYNHHHVQAPSLSGGVSTVLRVCPSCDNKVATTTTTAYSPLPVVATTAAIAGVSSPVSTPPPPSMSTTMFARPHFAPLAIHRPPVLRRQPSATS